MTGGKTRQKRNGPGGSGCFHAFCYFLAWPAQGFARRRPAGADVVHESPQNPCSFVGGHHVFGAKGAAGEPDVVLQSPQNPCSFVGGHHVFGAKGAAGEPNVVLHSPQTLALSSTGTTSLGPKALPASVPISISLQKERIDDGTSGQSVPSSISTDFNRNSWN